MPVLGVNIDHVATLRQARGVEYPSPLEAAQEAVNAGAKWIVAHLREDRRHIQDKDIYLIRRSIKKFNMEMAATPEMVRIACKVRPDQVTLVPEKRKELTTEGGLDIVKEKKPLKGVIKRFKREGIIVSLFLDPSFSQIEAAKECLADAIEIHTGRYADKGSLRELEKIKKACSLGIKLGFKVNVGHGLNYENVKKLNRIKGINEFNIGHSIVSRAVFVGMRQAVGEMLRLID
jgi:pyridoxine 5-phosphate synthase